jgi:hypothetical protein
MYDMQGKPLSAFTATWLNSVVSCCCCCRCRRRRRCHRTAILQCCFFGLTSGQVCVVPLLIVTLCFVDIGDSVAAVAKTGNTRL